MKSTIKKQIRAWYVYDLANTIFSALFLTFFFPPYIKEYLGGHEGHIGTVTGISTLLAGLTVPFAGALSDYIGRRMPFLMIFTIGCCVATALISISNLYWALGLAVMANFFYGISLAIYDALLPKLAPPDKQGTISGYGVGVGYLGTPISLIAVSILLYFLGWESEIGIRSVFVLTAVLFLGISIYPFMVIKEEKSSVDGSLTDHIVSILREIKQSVRQIPGIKGFLPFLLCAFFFYNAIMAVVLFLYLFGQEELGLTKMQFVPIYAGMAFAAAIGAVASGYLSDKFSPKQILKWSAWVWIVVLTCFIFVANMTVFVIGGMIGGMAMAAYLTAARPQLIKFADPQKMGEYFGFMALTNKASGFMGPAVFGWIVATTNYKIGLGVLIAFFVIGLVFLTWVPDEEKIVITKVDS